MISQLGLVELDPTLVTDTYGSRSFWGNQQPQSYNQWRPSSHYQMYGEPSAVEQNQAILPERARGRTNGTHPVYVLRVCQQPIRARLCSYKEENETIDRRPVDPPPVVELQTFNSDTSDLLDSTAFFVRVSIVQSNLGQTTDPYTSYQYASVKAPNGLEAATGEIIQTPERLKKLDGRSGSLCIFAKLSVRVPGVFRLKFTLYETTAMGIAEVAETVSDPFEVFSPKLFKGMKESTALTRHLASQGIKVKLRTDTSVGRQSDSRRRPLTTLGSKSSSRRSTSFRSPSLSPPLSVAPSSQAFSLDVTESSDRRDPIEKANRNTPDSNKGRTGPGDDGAIPSRRMGSLPRFDFIPLTGISDLSAFSLSNTGSSSKRSAESASARDQQGSGPNLSSGNGSLFTRAYPSNPWSLQNRTSATRWEIDGIAPLFTRDDFGTGDDGMGTFPTSSIRVSDFILPRPRAMANLKGVPPQCQTHLLLPIPSHPFSDVTTRDVEKGRRMRSALTQPGSMVLYRFHIKRSTSLHNIL